VDTPARVPGSADYAGSLEERDAAITRAIDALPSPVGAALTRGDLQSSLDNAIRERNADGRGR
jgi:hypothetical protein